MLDPGEEEEVNDEAVVGSPGGPPHYVVGVGSLRVLFTVHGEVKLFVLEKSGCGSAFRCVGSLFCIQRKAAYDTSRPKFTFDVKTAA